MSLISRTEQLQKLISNILLNVNTSFCKTNNFLIISSDIWTLNFCIISYVFQPHGFSNKYCFSLNIFLNVSLYPCFLIKNNTFFFALKPFSVISKYTYCYSCSGR